MLVDCTCVVRYWNRSMHVYDYNIARVIPIKAQTVEARLNMASHVWTVVEGEQKCPMSVFLSVHEQAPPKACTSELNPDFSYMLAYIVQHAIIYHNSLGPHADVK